jgi:DhnA family fructose-bisphosphate aldolase class Ia
MTATPLRLRRLIDRKSGRALFLSFTAALEVGVVPGLEDLPGMIAGLAADGQLTGAIVHAGVAESVFERSPGLPCGVIVDLFGGTWLTSRAAHHRQITTLEHAVRVGADGVMATISLGSKDEAYHLQRCGQIARECAAWGMPLLAWINLHETDASRQFSATLAGHGARIAYELGADLVVVNYTASADAFHEAIRGIAIPVLIGGGPHMETDAAMLESISQALRAGASGVALPATLFWQNGPTLSWKKLGELIGTTAK